LTWILLKIKNRYKVFVKLYRRAFSESTKKRLQVFVVMRDEVEKEKNIKVAKLKKPYPSLIFG